MNEMIDMYRREKVKAQYWRTIAIVLFTGGTVQWRGYMGSWLLG